jgi:hypothetical protein
MARKPLVDVSEQVNAMAIFISLSCLQLAEDM